jgi:hypothetical protein
MGSRDGIDRRTQAAMAEGAPPNLLGATTVTAGRHATPVSRHEKDRSRASGTGKFFTNFIGDPEFSLAVPDLYFFKILNKIRPLISNMATILKFDFENFEI